MFFEPVETPYDVFWRLFGVEIRINPWFWVMSAALGWSSVSRGFPFLLVWIACVLVSILVHEFGHVLVGRIFGSDGHIVLYSFGGLAVGSNQIPVWWKRILVCLAGPAAGFLFLGIILLGVRLLGDVQLNPYADEALFDLIWINFAWGILNLLPIWPLDGGQVSHNLLNWFNPHQGSYYAHGISFLCAALLAVNALVATRGHTIIPYAPTGIWSMILFGSLALGSYTALQEDNRPW